MSFQSSIENSLSRYNKENMNPNYKKTGTTSNIKLSNIRQSISIGSEGQMLSIFKSMNHKQFRDSKVQNAHERKNYMKNLQHFSSLSFFEILCIAFGRTNLSLSQGIQLSEKFGIFQKMDLLRMMQGQYRQTTQNSTYYRSTQQILKTNLGQLKVQELVLFLREDKELKSYHYEILQEILPSDLDQDITAEIVQQAFKLYKENIQLEQVQEVNLTSRYHNIIESKIESQLWSDHFRTGIAQKVKAFTEKERITFKNLSKILKDIVEESQVSIIFKYLYFLETKQSMPITDRTKTIKSKLLLQQLLKEGQRSRYFDKSEEKKQSPCRNTYKEYALQESNMTIKGMMKEKQKMLEDLNSKSKQIERLNKIIDFQRLQLEQEKKISKDRVKIEVEGCKRKYEKVVDDLKKGNEEKRIVIEWYQKELESVSEKLNTESLQMQNFTRDRKYWQRL